MYLNLFTYIFRNFYILKMADDWQGESGLDTSEDEDDDFEIVYDGNENLQPRIEVEGGLDEGDLDQERWAGNQTDDDRGDVETEIGDGGRDDASGSVNLDNTDNNGLVMPARKIKKPSPVWKCADRVPGGAKCKFCLHVIKCAKGSTSTIVHHVLRQHGNRVEVQVLQNDISIKRQSLNLKRLQDQKKKENNKQPSILNFSKRRGIMDPFKKRKLDEAIVKMTIMMNKPFSDVENTFFRQVIFTAEPNYICPSRTRVTGTFDLMAKKVKEDLKLDITKDVTEAGHKTLNICSDHGTSSDRFRTKKNAVTVARTTKDFVIKKDTLKLIICEGSQTGAQIRKDIKQALVLGAGWKEDWKINWVTDNESKQVNARDPSKHQAVELPTFHTGNCVSYSGFFFNDFPYLSGSCVDHTLELGTEESLQQCIGMKDPVKKVRSLINYMKDSSLAREEFNKIMEDAGVEPLAIIQGTSNR